mgnify:CR=1 FL=1|tara:strand:+ start:2284 stop:6855 length:4572 start_codon:yes stop_codon:yes gene_type:complete
MFVRMTKLMKILRHSIGIILEWTLVLLILLIFFIRAPFLQTYLANQATEYLAKDLNVDVKIDRVALVFPFHLDLDGLLLKDLENDTLLYAGTLHVKISDLNIKDQNFTFSDVELDRAVIHIKRNKDGVFNHQFIIDKYVKEKKKKKSKVHIDFNDVFLSNTSFRFDDDRYTPKKFGVDYFHLNSTNINTRVKNFSIANNVYSGEITQLSLKEKSGFVLDNLTSFVNVSSKGIHLSELKIKTPGSTIASSQLNMNSKEFPDFKKFVDNISFDAKIEKSSIALPEAAYFAYILKGMNDTVQLSTEMSRQVKNLKLSKIDLKIKAKTYIQGTLDIPDYRDYRKDFFHQRINSINIDLKELAEIKMPDSYNKSHLILDKTINKLKFFEGTNITLTGKFDDFVFASKQLSTALGSAKLDNGIHFSKNELNNTYVFTQSEGSEYDVRVENFNLGQFTSNKDLGIIDGIFFLTGEAFSSTDIRFHKIEGDINRFDYLGYSYNDIVIQKGELINKSFSGEIDIADDNIDLSYVGTVDFKDKLDLNFRVEIHDALLDQLNITTAKAKLTSSFIINLSGSDPNNFEGSVRMDTLFYEENGKTIELPKLTLEINRGVLEDFHIIKSDIVDAEIKGKINYTHILDDFKYQFGNIFPSLAKHDSLEEHLHNSDNFYFDIDIKEPNDFLAIFSPKLHIAPNSKIKGHFLDVDSDFKMDIVADYFKYDNITFNGLDLTQVMNTSNIAISYHINDISIGDTSLFSDIFYKASGQQDILNSSISWGQNTKKESSLIWETTFFDWDHYNFILEPSYLSVQELRWEVENASKFSINSDTISVQEFELRRNHQFITLNGIVSKRRDHKLFFNVENIILEELSTLLNKVPFAGTLEAKGHISDPFNDFQFIGDGTIDTLTVKDQLVGNINVNSKWIEGIKGLKLFGDLNYRDAQTFDFLGHYYPFIKEDNLDFNLDFDKTDISFTNAFFSPDLVTGISGFLDGQLKVSGSPNQPILKGDVHLLSGSAKVGILGASFGVDGIIEVDEYGFYINSIPVFDEEGNAGKIIGSVYHDNFSDFNFDLMFDIEDDAINKDPDNPWKTLPLDQFLVLNTAHTPGDSYYGKAYATGIVNIFGYTDNLEIAVDLKSKRGTQINIPMYGVGDLDDESFIVFLDKDSTVIVDHPKLDFTGVALDMNFEVTPDAIVKLIFSTELEDEITARGSGDISINLNNIGDITMDGVYTVKNGIYDFAMGPVKQKFFIEEGGSINWTGDPYEAQLDLQTFYKVNTNIAVLTSNQLAEGSGSHQEILCYLKLTESLSKPAIQFDIAAPNASDIAQSVITRIKSDPDELNRQFFSLLLWRRFAPLIGSSQGNGNTAINLFANQINSILSKISSNYLLNVDLNSDQLTGDNSYEFGIKKGFLDDRLVLTGSFGVGNQKVDETTDESYVIGDVHLEYLLNASGTFRVNVFNESNDQSILQNQDKGTFTQGAGLTYKEDFHTADDFKAIQYFLDVFRKKKNKRYPIKRKRQQVLVPKQNGSSSGVNP